MPRDDSCILYPYVSLSSRLYGTTGGFSIYLNSRGILTCKSKKDHLMFRCLLQKSVRIHELHLPLTFWDSQPKSPPHSGVLYYHSSRIYQITIMNHDVHNLARISYALE